MAIGFRTIIALLVFLLVFVVGGILLQIFLSKRESRWPGLVLPAITFLFSLLMVLNLMALGGIGQVIGSILTVLITGNIPTLILLAIYFACRGRRNKRAEMDRMNIEDL